MNRPITAKLRIGDISKFCQDAKKPRLQTMNEYQSHLSLL